MVRSNAPGLSSSVSGLHTNICTLILIGLTLIGLSACNFASSQDNGSTNQNSPEARREELKTDIPAGSRDLTIPPSGNDGFSVNPVSLNAPGSTANSDLQPAKGLSSKRLFSESLGEDARLDRLEAAVQAMRDEFDTVTPSINRLIAVEADIQELVAQLNTLVQGEGAMGTQNDEISVTQLDNGQDAINRAMGIPEADPFAEGALQNGTGETPQPPPAPPAAATTQPLQIAPPPPPMAAAAPPVAPPPAPAQMAAANRTETPQPPPAAAPPPRPPDPTPPVLVQETTTTTTPAAGQPQLTNVRMADSGGKTRIVMEATGLMTFTADVDNTENILTLIFPAGTSVDVGAFASGSKLVRTVSMTPQASGGFILAFTLNKGSSIINQGKIAPNADNPRHRIFIDLAN
jgi:hypothetical protein